MGTLARLEELLELKDQQLAEKDKLIEEIQAQNSDLEGRIRQAASGWSLPQVLKGQQTLPTPRLEMLVEKQGEYRMVWKYRLVKKHLDGDVLAIPLGEVEGIGHRQFPPRDFEGNLERPWRQGADMLFDMEHLGYPGYMICGDLVEQISLPTR